MAAIDGMPMIDMLEDLARGEATTAADAAGAAGGAVVGLVPRGGS